MNNKPGTAEFAEYAFNRLTKPNTLQQFERLIYGCSTCVIKGIQPDMHQEILSDLRRRIEATEDYENGFELEIKKRSIKPDKEVDIVFFKPSPYFGKDQIG